MRSLDLSAVGSASRLLDPGVYTGNGLLESFGSREIDARALLYTLDRVAKAAAEIARHLNSNARPENRLLWIARL